MPIDYGDVTWPPAECHRPAELYREWGAWYSGNTDELMAVYGGSVAFSSGVTDDRHPLARPAQYSAGVKGKLARLWWGRPTSSEQPAAKVHLPAAGDLSMYAADLLYGSPPDITIGEPSSTPGADGAPVTVADPATVYWDEAAEAIGWDSRLLEAGEVGSAYGGAYLRASVMPEVDGYRPIDYPIMEAIPPDAAIPVFRSGFLVAVTFWRELERSSRKLGGETVWRHLERHEPGMVYHALYVGTADKLGQPVTLEARPETAGLLDSAPTGCTGLAVQYVPNMRPHRMIRGSALGRSDYSGAEMIMDSLDETWSSWMRDIRLAKGRVVAPEVYLQSGGPGQGATFDAEREIWASVNTMPKADGAAGLSIVQFGIRVQEHRDTAAAALRQIWRTAGYSTGENGEENEAQAAATATQVVSRASRTAATRNRKIGYATPGVRGVVRSMLEMAVHFKLAPDGVRVDRSTPISVEFPPAHSPDPKAIAETVNLLSQAQAISTRVKVETVHPDWTEPEVAAEVAAITGALAPPEQPVFD